MATNSESTKMTKKDICIEDTMFKTGWDRQTAESQIENTIASLGISYNQYKNNNFCRVSQEEQQKYWNDILEKKANKAAAASAVKKVSKRLSQGEAETPYGTKISNISADGVEFYWKKPEFATTYEVFRAYDSAGPFEKIADIPKRTIGTYTDSDFDHSKKEIYFQVRSIYVDKEGNESVSPMSDVTKAEYLENMELSNYKIFMYSDSTKSIHAMYGWGEPEHAKWESDNESIATIDENGVISALSKGTCHISCTNLDNGAKAFADVTVDREATEPLGPIETRYEYDEEQGFWFNPKGTNTNKATIMMAGDMMCASTQMKKQYSEPQGWNFNDSFKYVRPVFTQSDLAIGNVETLLAAPWPYMLDEAWIDNKNNCNAPARYLDAVRYAGFDCISMSNNHNCDGGIRALLDTMDQVDRYKFIKTGTFRTDDEPRFAIINVNGIKVGLVSYMTARTTFNGKDKTWTKAEKKRHLNVFQFEDAKRDIENCRNAGAEFVIAYMHWGTKNYRNLTEDQDTKAQEAANAGADLIIGSNPHLVQAYKEIVTEDKRCVPCYFSVGNFQAVMNQVDGNRESIIVKIGIEKDRKGTVKIVENEYIPCYCYSNCDGACWSTVPLPKEYNTTSKNGVPRILTIDAAVGKEETQGKSGLKSKLASMFR